MNRRRDLFVLLFFLLFFFLFIYLIFGLITPSDSLDDLSLSGGEKVALIKIVGGIYDSKPILSQLDKIEESKAVKAVVLRLETPGGAVAASQEIYRRLKYLRDEKGIPIVASMGNVAASGGYYVALGADTIIANPGTITGSIGVIASIFQYQRLFEKLGVSVETVKSGKFKDTGSPFRGMTGEEREYLQSLIDDTYDQFVHAVAEGRNLEVAEVELLADGRVYTGRQAKELGLIDLLGGLDEAVQIAGELGGISGKPQVVELAKKKLTLLDILLGDLEEIIFLKLGLATPLKYELPQSF